MHGGSENGRRWLRFICWLSRCNPDWKEARDMRGEGRAECGRQALFEDPDFPSDDTSLFCDSSTPIVKLQGNITWLRPQVGPSALCSILQQLPLVFVLQVGKTYVSLIRECNDLLSVISWHASPVKLFSHKRNSLVKLDGWWNVPTASSCSAFGKLQIHVFKDKIEYL